ncbi:MAG: aminotransferase class IV [Thermoleophilia bacterium]|nr:aminotransferase class IV [Thermoleophilia bacterium]
MDDEVLYLNGQFSPLSEGRIEVEDRGFQLGDSVYEVVKVMNGRTIWLDDHLARLEQTLAAIGMPGATEKHRLSQVVPELLSRSGLLQGMVYIQVTRGASAREFEFPEDAVSTVLAYTRATRPPDPEKVRAGMVLHPVEDIRWGHCDIKTTGLLATVLAKEEARRAGADEAVFVGPGGTLRECGSSNLFAVIGGVLRTHPLDGRILGGITRSHVLDIARRQGLVIDERAFTVAEMAAPPNGEVEAFIASTLRDIMPVVRIGAQSVGDGRPGQVTMSLLDIMQREQVRLVGLEPSGASS